MGAGQPRHVVVEMGKRLSSGTEKENAAVPYIFAKFETNSRGELSTKNGMREADEFHAQKQTNVEEPLAVVFLASLFFVLVFVSRSLYYMGRAPPLYWGGVEPLPLSLAWPLGGLKTPCRGEIATLLTFVCLSIMLVAAFHTLSWYSYVMFQPYTVFPF